MKEEGGPHIDCLLETKLEEDDDNGGSAENRRKKATNFSPLLLPPSLTCFPSDDDNTLYSGERPLPYLVMFLHNVEAFEYSMRLPNYPLYLPHPIKSQ